MDESIIIYIIIILWVIYLISIFRSTDKTKKNGIRLYIKVPEIQESLAKLHIDTPNREGVLMSFLLAYIIYSISDFSSSYYLFFILFAGAVLGKKFGTIAVFTGKIIFPLIFKNGFGIAFTQILYTLPNLNMYNINYLNIFIISITSIISTRFVGIQVEKHSNKGVKKHNFIMFKGWIILYVPLIIIYNRLLDYINIFSHLVILLLVGYISHKLGQGKLISFNFNKTDETSENKDFLSKIIKTVNNMFKSIDFEKINKATSDKVDELKKVVNVGNTTSEEDISYNTIIIEVFNPFKTKALRNVKVTIEPVGGGKPIEQYSDIDGKVIFGKVADGVYNLKASLSGFEDFSKEITVDKNDRISIELKGKSILTINVMDIATKEPVTGAIIDINGSKFITDEKGLVVFSDLSVGNYDINVTKDSYKQETLSIEVTGDQQEIKVSLKPDIELSGKLADKAVRIQSSIKEAMDKLSAACDMGIPEYYRGICLELVKFNEIIASTPMYVYSEQSHNKIEALYTITEKICKEIEIVLTNGENITEYINMADKGIKSIPSVSINLKDYDSIVKAYFENINDFLLNFKPIILNKLQETDAEITNNIQEYNINPIAHLWEISQIIISGDKNEYEEGASLLLTNILLDYTKNMFKNEEITKRLKL